MKSLQKFYKSKFSFLSSQNGLSVINFISTACQIVLVGDYLLRGKLVMNMINITVMQTILPSVHNNVQ